MEESSIVPLYVGFDDREPLVYHVFCQSVIDQSSCPVALIPLAQNLLHFDGRQDGTNQFIYSRYLIPWLQDYEGWAIYADGDMVVTTDIKELFDLRDEDKAVMVVKHDYRTKNRKKYIGSPMESDNVDYPRKNWSSVILWNCGHPSNKVLTRDLVEEAGGAFLHRFEWLNDDEIGELPADWNFLVGEEEERPAHLYHYTLGCPGFEHYMRCDHNREWNRNLLSALRLEGERPKEIVRRASWRS